MKTKFGEVVPMKTEVVLKNRNPNDFKGNSSILLWETSDSKVNYFEVVVAGEEVSHVKVGDVVLVPWSNCTPPFVLDGEKFVVTDEKEILAQVVI